MLFGPTNTPGLVLTGIFLDPITGPFAMSRPVATLRQTDNNHIIEINDSVTEDIYSQNELDARYAQLGWPSLSRLPSKPGDISSFGDQPTIGAEIWASRRFMVQRVSVNVAPEDLRPVEPFVEAIEEALGQETRVLQLKALQKVFANMVAGASLAVTGTLSAGTQLPDGAPPNSPPGDRPYNLSDIIDRHLSTSRTFVRKLESRVQGGFSEALLNEGYEGWLKSVAGRPRMQENPATWTVVKVHRVVPITDILGDKLRRSVEQVFGSSLVYRSPGVGAPHGSGFECDTKVLRAIERIKVWYSDSRIRDISIKYVGGAVSGPYSFGTLNPQSQSDDFILGSGEYITDVFVWYHVDGWIAGPRADHHSPPCSPERQWERTFRILWYILFGFHMPGQSKRIQEWIFWAVIERALLRQAVWRRDITVGRYRHTQTSFTGALHGFVFNDLQHLADPATSRIAEITARAENSLANLCTTYVSISGGAIVRSETPARGTDRGPLQTMILEDDEYIIGVRGNVTFDFKAPKNIDGKDMVLHYMAGKACGCVHSILFVWADKSLQATDIQ
ncbi:hypothetical protein AG1IA_02966 [Rhizoctonia solani AG-1 IA]|uniref:Jacalin domain-containing protein n=1 Tax=Thanatephorus cucumeris (strain AG1-IA) TaxID=983506 RepID=L8WY43_THACA|nr:hypothetical protein AG1IA_02966 [Rhizoctonia solani AG-1 IA]